MNYRDFYKKIAVEDFKGLIPEGITKKDFARAVILENRQVNDVSIAARIASRNLKEDLNYYKKLYEDYEQEEGCSCGEEEGVEPGNEYDDNDGLPTLGGALNVHHHGQPIMLGKVIQVGNEFGHGTATGELGGMTSVNKGVAKDTGGLEVEPDGDKELITAGGKEIDGSIASKTVGGEVTPGGGQKQGGLNSKGTIASTSQLSEQKQKVLKIAKELLKEIKYDKKTGKWSKINESEMCDMKMGPSYKVVQPHQYKTVEDMPCRRGQYEPDIQEMYDDEEECMMNERYVELANSKRNLSETELAEMKSLREKIDRLGEADKWIQKAVKHPGRCAHPGDKNCPKGSPQYNLAMRFKHGDIHKDNLKKGEEQQDENFKKSFEPHFGKDWAEEEQEEEKKLKGKNPKKIKSNEPEGYKFHEPVRPDPYTGEKPEIEREGYQEGDYEKVKEGRCEDYPCCGHEEGGCPDRDEHGNETYRCAGCGARLPRNSESSLCRGCLRRGIERAESGEDFGDMQESTVDMKMGPSYKIAQPRQYKVEDDDFPRTNQYDPQIQELGGGAVQHSSYRTVPHGNLPQNGKQRWENDIDEGASKVSKTIAKGQKPKSSTFSQKLKHQTPKKTTSGVHKRKR